MGFKDQAGDVILLRWNERVGHNLLKRHVSQRELGCDALLLRSRRQPGQLVAGFFLIGLGKKVSQVTELKAFVHFWRESLSAERLKRGNHNEISSYCAQVRAPIWDPPQL